MEKSLISLDISSCINKRKKFSFFSKLIFKELLQKGHLLIFAFPYDINNNFYYIKKLHLFNYPLICFNGGEIMYINRKNKIIKRIYNPLKKDEINDLFYKIRNIKVECTIYYENKNELHYSPFLKKTVDDDAISIKISLNKINKDMFEKILKKLSYINYYLLEENENLNYIIISKKSNKLNMIKKLQKEFKIKDENVICFENNHYDEDLLNNYKNSYLLKENNIVLYQDNLIFKKSVIKILFKNHHNLFN